MIPRLIVISGKMKGTVFALSEGEASIGREPANVICLNDPSVSRRHCQIECDGDERFFVRDLGSFNGVFVNGIPTNEQELKHGDQLAIGDVVALFTLTESESVFDSGAFTLTEDTVAEQSTIKLARKDAVYLSPEKLLAEFPQIARATGDLSVLLQIIAVLNQTKDLGLAQKRLLELIVKAIPAERAAIFLTEEDSTAIFSHHFWSADGEDEPMSISKTIVEQCLREGISVLCNDVGGDEKFRLIESLAATNTHSVVCSPLLVFEKVIGVIYLDMSDSDSFFDMDHLQLLTGISEISSRPLENAISIDRLKSENERLLEQLDDNYKMIGESTRMKEVFSIIAKVAPTDSTVLISGESGTGKELAARSIHQNSNRSKEPFVALNCATLTENLLESELFGHERGAFTGAIAAKKGQFELAEGGTIFLDEIGELAVSLQAKLLRVLQEREITRVGGSKAKKIDVRLITATNKDLAGEVKNGNFRRDLYYRLNVINLMMPALRDRPEDMKLLTRYFLNKYNQKCKRNIKGFVPEVMTYFQNYGWAGNVRELENIIERALILSLGDMITLDDLPEALLERSISNVNEEGEIELTYHNAVSDAKKKIIEQALSKTNNNVAKAAESLGIHPNNLHRLIKQFDLRSVE